MSDAPIPDLHLPWEEYRTRLLAAFAKCLDKEGASTSREVFNELWDLLGCVWVPELCQRLRYPPRICPGCGHLFRPALPDEQCGDCIDKAAEKAKEAEIEARVIARLKSTGEF